MRLLEHVDGEYWLFPNGKWARADGGDGSIGHLEYAADFVRRELADRFVFEPDASDAEVSEAIAAFTLREARKRGNEGLADTIEAYIRDDPSSQFDAAYEGLTELYPEQVPLYSFVIGTGDRNNLREWVSKTWGWVAMRGNHLEAYVLDRATLNTIERGVSGVVAEQGINDPDEKFFVDSYKGARTLTFTLAQLEAGNLAAGDSTGRSTPMGRNAALAKLDRAGAPAMYGGTFESRGTRRLLDSVFVQEGQDDIASLPIPKSAKRYARMKGKAGTAAPGKLHKWNQMMGDLVGKAPSDPFRSEDVAEYT